MSSSAFIDLNPEFETLEVTAVKYTLEDRKLLKLRLRMTKTTILQIVKHSK